MLCKATEADLEQMVAFRRKTYGGTRQDALDWLCGIVGLDNILIQIGRASCRERV